jgi:hypothetical protein
VAGMMTDRNKTTTNLRELVDYIEIVGIVCAVLKRHFGGTEMRIALDE